MMHEYNLTVGLFDKDLEIQVINTEDAKKALDHILIERFELFAYTMMDCQGVYKMESTGCLVHEPSIRIEIATDVEIDIKAICQAIKKELNQESVMVKHTMSDIDFI